LFAGREGCLGCDADQFRQEFYFSAVLQSGRTEDFKRKVSEQCDFSYLLVVHPNEDQIKEGQSLGLTCASIQDINDLLV